MSKFKKGDRVRNLVADRFLNIGDLGTVNEDNTKSPYVNWDGKPFGELGYAQNELDMELAAKPSRETVTIHRKKKAVVATITDGENTYSQFTKLSDANNDFKTAVKMVVERLMDKWAPIDGKETENTVNVQLFHNGKQVLSVDCPCDGGLEMVTSHMDWDGFKSGKFSVHCDTEEKAREFLKECDGNGITWCTGHRTTEQEEIRWNVYMDKTAYGCDSHRGLSFGTYDEKPKIDYAPSKPTVKEVHRRANAGEYVKIINAIPGSKNNHYKSGDIMKIIMIDRGYRHFGNGMGEYLYDEEYDVLENYQPEEPKAAVKEEPKADTAPKPFVKAKVGDTIKVVKVVEYHCPKVANGDEFIVKETTNNHVTTDSNSFYDSDAEYIIIESAPDKPVNKSLSAYTNRELSAELLRRYEQEGK